MGLLPALGESSVVKWLIGLVLAAALGGITGYFSQKNATDYAHASGLADHGARLAVGEEKDRQTEGQILKINHQLDALRGQTGEIGTKIDILLAIQSIRDPRGFEEGKKRTQEVPPR